MGMFDKVKSEPQPSDKLMFLSIAKEIFEELLPDHEIEIDLANDTLNFDPDNVPEKLKKKVKRKTAMEFMKRRMG